MSFERVKIPAMTISMILLVATICLFTLAGISAQAQSATSYNLSGYVFVDGVPTDNVLVYTTYGGGSNAVTGPDGAGRHGYYTLSTAASPGPAKILALYTGSNISHSSNFSTSAVIERPDADAGYGTLNLFIDTDQNVTASVSQPEGKLIDRVADVFNNFIWQISNWVKINSGVSPYNNATSGAVVSRAIMFDGSAISYTDLALVDANDTRKEMYHVRSNERGFYNFTVVRNTYNINSGDYDSSYRLKADLYGDVNGKRMLIGEGVSAPFSLMPGQVANVTAVIFTRPNNITVSGPDSIGMTGNDHVTYTAYVTDGMDRPVPDGCRIQFTLSNNNIGMGELAPNGSSVASGLYVTASTSGGYARAEYGWVTRPGVNAIRAAYEQDMNVNASTAVELR